jgi:hypothetical protein
MTWYAQADSNSLHEHSSMVKASMALQAENTAAATHTKPAPSAQLPS